MDYTHLNAFIKQSLPDARYAHCISTAEQTATLLKRFGKQKELQEAYLVGLWHDVARHWSNDKLLEYAQQHALEPLAEEKEDPMLLHGAVAATMLKAMDPTVANRCLVAIRWHTLGSSRMGLLGCCLYIADYIEPLRAHVTKMFRQNLLALDTVEQMCLRLITQHASYLASKGKKMAQTTRELKQFLLDGGEFSW